MRSEKEINDFIEKLKILDKYDTTRQKGMRLILEWILEIGDKKEQDFYLDFVTRMAEHMKDFDKSSDIT